MFRFDLLLLALIGTAHALGTAKTRDDSFALKKLSFLPVLAPASTCDVGELEKEIEVNTGQCNDRDDPDAKCSGYRTRKYGDELSGSACSPPREGTTKRECICKISKS